MLSYSFSSETVHLGQYECIRNITTGANPEAFTNDTLRKAVKTKQRERECNTL